MELGIGKWELRIRNWELGRTPNKRKISTLGPNSYLPMSVGAKKQLVDRLNISPPFPLFCN